MLLVIKTMEALRGWTGMMFRMAWEMTLRLKVSSRRLGFLLWMVLSVGVLAWWTVLGGGEEFKLVIYSDVEVQGELSSALSKDEVGDAANSTDSKARDSPLEGVDGTDGMEFDGGGIASPTN